MLAAGKSDSEQSNGHTFICYILVAQGRCAYEFDSQRTETGMEILPSKRADDIDCATGAHSIQLVKDSQDGFAIFRFIRYSLGHSIIPCLDDIGLRELPRGDEHSPMTKMKFAV